MTIVATEPKTIQQCPHYNLCGNCDIKILDYKEQLIYKTNLVKNALSAYPDALVTDCEGMFFPFKYRNKVTLAFVGGRGFVDIGFYRAGSKEVIDINECMLHDAWITKLLATTREFVGKFKLDGYDVDLDSGTLRYLVARFVDNALCVTIVATKKKVIGLSWFYKKLTENFKRVSLYLNINNSQFSNVFGEEFMFVDGTKNLTADYLGVKIELKPKIFLQVNEKIASKIYREIIDFVLKTGYKSIIDAYCGIGLTSLFFAKNGLDVIGIERETQSVIEAVRLARNNHLTNIQFLEGNAEKLFPKALATGAEVVFVDPPRKGLEGATLPLMKAAPTFILYLSCSPDTLKTDLATLSKQYTVEFAHPYDMFPQTHHVETLCCLKRK